MDPGRLEPALSPRTRAILAVHQIGMPCDLEAICALARRHGVALVEDAACAAGSEIRWGGAWQRIGRPHGDVACFSFHPRKLVSTAARNGYSFGAGYGTDTGARGTISWLNPRVNDRGHRLRVRAPAGAGGPRTPRRRGS